jgi:hypothetical protein
MWRVWILALSLMFPSICSYAADQRQIDQILDAIDRLCLSGTQYQFKADVNGNISIKKLLPGAEGGVNVNIKNSRGAVDYLNEEIRRYVDADTRQCTQPWIDKVVNLILNVTPGQSELSGTWSIIDPRANQPFATVELGPDGSFKGGGFPPSLGGPNGLGANQYRFENGVLKFIYIQPGRPRIDEMLVGSVRKVSDYEFTFTVAGGYYGGQNRNMTLVFKRL